MQSQFSDTEQAFADQVELFITEHWLNQAEPRRRLRAWLNDADTAPLRQQWYRRVVEAGWAVPHWPPEFGGCDWSAAQLHIWFSACVRHQTPIVLTFATAHVGPLLIEYGNKEQKALLPKIAAFEESWCLGWAERGAVVDDYALSTRAVQEAGGKGITYVNGAKTRVLDGMHANWMICVALAAQDQPCVLLVPLQQKSINRTPKAALSTGQPMAEIEMCKATVPTWGTLAVSTQTLRALLSGFLETDLSSLADGAALAEQTQKLKQQLLCENNVEEGLLRDCDALAIEALGLEGMEQRLLHSATAESADTLPFTAVRLRAQTLWSKLSELQIAAFGYYALPFVDGLLSDNEGAVDPRRPSGEIDMTMVMRRMLSPTIATELGLDPRDTLAQQALGLPEQEL